MTTKLDDLAHDFISMGAVEPEDITTCQKGNCGASVMPWQITCPGCGATDFREPDPAPTYTCGTCYYADHESMEDAEMCCATCACGCVCPDCDCEDTIIRCQRCGCHTSCPGCGDGIYPPSYDECVSCRQSVEDRTCASCGANFDRVSTANRCCAEFGKRHVTIKQGNALTICGLRMDEIRFSEYEEQLLINSYSVDLVLYCSKCVLGSVL